MMRRILETSSWGEDILLTAVTAFLLVERINEIH